MNSKTKSPKKNIGLVGEDWIQKMTAEDFEYTVCKYILELGLSLPDFEVHHNSAITGTDGIYQIDVLASYTALGVKMIVLIECKRYKTPVTREKVQVLNDKLNSTGAHKGILFSTSGFQSGAIEYAIRHKIALIQLLNNRFKLITNSLYTPKPKLNIYTPPKPDTFMGECFYNDKVFYIDHGDIGGLVKCLTVMEPGLK